MAEKKTGAAKDEKYDGFSAEERAAMKERAKELKGSKRRSGKKDGESDVLAKIAEMPEPERGLAQRFHEIVKATAPDLAAKTWYGMPAYAKGGKNVCFFQAASKFGTRYSTIGFEEAANLDDGTMWATGFAITEMTPANEE